LKRPGVEWRRHHRSITLEKQPESTNPKEVAMANPYPQSTASYPSADTSFADRLAGRSEDTLLLAGRLALGVIFVKSGLQKLMALGAFAASLAGRGVPQSSFWAVVGATVEFVGGILIVTGLKTRYASLLMILFVIAATGISHRYWEFADAAARRAQESNFFKNLSIIGGFLVLFVSGSGRFGLDAVLKRKSGT
jgi:putative oxidoreductase